MKTKFRVFLTSLFALAVAVFGAVAFGDAGGLSVKSEAAVVSPSGYKDTTDVKAIISALQSTKKATLRKGKTYYLASPIHMKSGYQLYATGATIICEKNAIMNDPAKTGYASFKNVKVVGGTWKCRYSSGYKGTSFSLAHGSGVTFRNMKVYCTNYDGHAFEMVACKNVLMENVTAAPKGTAKKSEEAMVQIDIATGATFPRCKGTKLENGACCQNVTIRNCKISGNRALTTGYDYNKSTYINKYHTGLTITDNQFVSQNGAGLFLANVKDAEISGNTIISNLSSSEKTKSTGMHILMFGSIPGSSFSITNNTIKGGYHGVRIYSESGTYFENIDFSNNRVYWKNGNGGAINIKFYNSDTDFYEQNSVYTW